MSQFVFVATAVAARKWQGRVPERARRLGQAVLGSEGRGRWVRTDRRQVTTYLWEVCSLIRSVLSWLCNTTEWCHTHARAFR